MPNGEPDTRMINNRVDTKNVYNLAYERPAMMKQLPLDMTGMKVLDAGSAAGWYTQQITELVAEVVATSPEMFTAIKRSVGKSAEVFCLDLEEKLPFGDESFDYIVSSLVLHYIKDWIKVFTGFRRVLKPNDILLFSTHHPLMDIKLVASDDYFSTELIVGQWKRGNKMSDVPFYRRPLNVILNETLAQFTLEKIIEPQPTKEFEQKGPGKYEKLMKSLHFIIVKAFK